MKRGCLLLAAVLLTATVPGPGGAEGSEGTTQPSVGEDGLVDLGIACAGVEEDVSCDGPAVSVHGDAESCEASPIGCVGVSATGNSSASTAVSGTGNSSGERALSGTGDATTCEASGSFLRPCLAVSGTGTATGQLPVSALGDCRHDADREPRRCVAASPTGDAEGHYAAVSGTGNASANAFAASGTGHADSDLLAASATGTTSCKPHPPIVVDGDPSDDARLENFQADAILPGAVDEAGEQAGLATGFAVRDPATGTATPRPGSGVVGGNGTEDDPYRIEGWCIRAAQPPLQAFIFHGCPDLHRGAAIQVCDTEAHVRIANNTIVGERPHVGPEERPMGIRLANVSNVTLAGNEIVRTSDAVVGTEVDDSRLIDNRIRDTRWSAVIRTSHDVTLRENTVEDVGLGLFVSGSNHAVLDNRVQAAVTGIELVGEDSRAAGNVVADTHRAIEIDGGDHRVADNRVEDAFIGIRVGILLAGEGASRANQVVGNTVESSRVGLSFLGAVDTHVRDNRLDGGLDVLVPDEPLQPPGGIPDERFLEQDVDASNTVDGEPIRYLVDEDGAVVTEPAGQVVVADSSNVRVEALDVSDVFVGVQVYASQEVSIHNATVADTTTEGVRVLDTEGFKLSNSQVEGAGCEAVDLDVTPGATVTDSRLSRNPDAACSGQVVELRGSPSSLVEHNAIAGSTEASGHNGTGVVVFRSSSSSIEENRISGDATDRSPRIGVKVRYSQDVEVSGNNIHGHDVAGVDALRNDDRVDARHNWWGCPGGPEADACDDVRGDEVVFTPWLTDPNPDAGPREGSP